jgi:VWFA-related protein
MLVVMAQVSAQQSGSQPGAPAGQQPAAAPAEQTPPYRFRSAVDLVSVAAVVRDRKGRFVKDLSKQDFEIVEAGRNRPIVDFRAELNGPVKLAVLLDISGSMRVGQRTADARQAASHIFSSLAGADQAAVFTFDTALAQAQAFTSDRQVLEAAMGSADKPFGQTSLYDAIAQTAKKVAAASGTGPKGLPQRSAVIVITDGIDTRSNMTPAAVSAAASSIDVPVYIVAVVAAVDDPRETNHRRSAAMASDLQELARGTGGELFIASAPAHASMAARQMVDELRHQYVLAFEASSQSGWRPLEVRTRQDELVVRARTGYSGGAPSPSSGEEAASTAGSRTSQRPAQAGR